MQKRGSRVENLARWRSTNPTGHENSPSFAELLEKFHRTTRNSTDSGATLFSRFIDTVLTTWGTEGRPLSREKLCHLIKERHPRNETLTNTVLYNWKNHPAYSPRTESLTVLAEAFQLNQLHELLMFRLAKGTPCGNLKELLSAAERAIRTPDERRTRGELFTALCDASGIPLVVLAKTLAAQQVSYWKQGQRIEDRVMARRIVQLVNAPAIYPKDEREEVRELNSRIVAVLGGRLNSVLDAVFLAERSEVANSGGLLLALLIGQRGLAPLDYHAVAQLLNVTREKVHHMSSSSERRGGQITEAAAATILDYVQGVNAATRHLLSPVQRAERELALDTLTGIPSPVRLMWKLQNGEISHVGELCRLTRQRRGVLQESGMSGFELNKAGLSHARAAETADWLGFTEPQHRELRRLFITMATRTHTIQTPSQILDEIMSGQVPRHIGFQKLIDWTGLTRAEVARTMQLSKSSVAGYTMPHRGGRIVGERPLRALADELRLYHRSDDLVAVFSPKSYPEAHEQADIAGSEQLSTKRGISA
jgi:transcriptional regulator with XRE-family HTH domain